MYYVGPPNYLPNDLASLYIRSVILFFIWVDDEDAANWCCVEERNITCRPRPCFGERDGFSKVIIITTPTWLFHFCETTEKDFSFHFLDMVLSLFNSH
jgi:hypothetical protein